MNVTNLQKLIDLFEGKTTIKGLGFDMSVYCHQDNECGTVACIAGHAMLLGRRYKTAPKDDRVNDIDYGAFDYAQEWLDLSFSEANMLFHGETPDDEHIPMATINTEHVVKVLKHLLRTGEVDWRITGLAAV